jgi:Ca2+-binding RTX toxin-like protein
MAVVTISTASGFDFDDLDFPDLTTGTTATKTATTWRVTQAATTFDEYTGSGLKYATVGLDSVPNGGTITGFKHVENGVTEIQVTTLNLPGATFKTLFDGGDFTAFLSNVLGGKDTITGGAGADHLLGFGGDDTIDGKAGADTMEGGTGSDVYIVDNANDAVVEAALGGSDTIKTSVAIDLGGASFAGQEIENVIVTAAGAVNITGNALNNTITGGSGVNVLLGLEGDDLLNGLGGNDQLLGGDHNDTLDGGLGNDKMEGGFGNDVYIVDSKTDTIVDADGNDTVQSKLSIDLTALAGGALEHAVLTGTGAVNATGNAENNQLTGNDGANALNGKVGADTMSGGKGDDTYTVNEAGDVVTESVAGAAGGVDLVRSAITLTLGANVENLTLTGLLNIDGKGNSLANVITGNGGNNRLTGLGGNDTLSGGKGNDIYVVNSVADKVEETLSLAAGGGTDTVQSSVTLTLAALANVENLTLLGASGIGGTGNAAANVIIGNAGANKLDGAAGDDSLVGGAGNDTMIGGANIDDLAGGNDDDTYEADSADDLSESLSGGIDSVKLTALAAGKTYDLDAKYENVEHFTLLGNLAGTILGNDAGNILIGNDAANKISGGHGDDLLSGGAGNDTMNGGLGEDLLNGGAGNDMIEFAVGDGGDTIAAGSLNTGDVIKLLGTDVYDFNYDWFNDGNLYIAQAIDENFSFDDTGFLRLANFWSGTGSIQVQIDTQFNDFYGTNANLATFTFQRGVTGTNNSTSSEVIVGQDGNDKIDGKGGFYDSIFGGRGNDTITGGSNGFDNLRGGGGNDVINALGGDDRLRGDYGFDTLNGGGGFDQADYRNSSFGVVVNLAVGMALDDGNGGEEGKGTADTLISIEDVRGSNFNDYIVGDGGANFLTGLGGDDTMAGAGGSDGFDLGSGFDQVQFNAFGEGDDFIEDWNKAEDQIAFNLALDVGKDGILNDLQAKVASVTDDGTDVAINFLNGSTLTFGGIGNGTIDTLGELFDDPDNQLAVFEGTNQTGGAGKDDLVGGDGRDVLRGDLGNDTLNGSFGDDVLDGGAGNDTFEFQVGRGQDTVIATNTGDVIALLGKDFYDINFEWWDGSLYIAQAINGDYNLDDTGYIKLSNFFTGTGSINVKIDTANYNEFYGTNPNISTFTFQRGLTGTNNANSAEVIIGTNGDDKIDGKGGFYDSVFGNDGNDTITGGGGTDFLRGGLGNDQLFGLGGDDSLRGDSGHDTLDGGIGNDRADYRRSDFGVLVNLAVGVASSDSGGAFFDVDKLISIEDVRGTEFGDVITGNAVSNVIQGLAGEDVIVGAGGDDFLRGGDDGDTFHFNAFGEGNDVIEDWNGLEDSLAFAAALDVGKDGILDDLEAAIATVDDFGAGNDVVVTFDNGKTLTFVGVGTGAIDEISDLVDGLDQIDARGDTTKTGNDGNNNLVGTGFHDVLIGGKGNDKLTGGQGNDILDGGLGNDTYIISNGSGFDTIAAGTYNTGDAIKILGADFYDINFGWNHGNLHIAGAVDADYDFLDTGNVTIANFFGGTGSIQVQIDTAEFNLDYGTDANLATFTFQRGLTGTNNATSSEVIIGTTGDDKIDGKGGYYDALFGDNGNDTITGGGGSDWIRGGNGNDVMSGLGGDDRLRGDFGNDTLNGGAGIDRADYRFAETGVIVNLTLGLASDDGHGTIDTLIAIENVRGGAFDDRITGNTGDNLLEGRDGFDTLSGGGGDDTLDGGADADFLRFGNFGEGHDVVLDWNSAEDNLAFADILDVGNDGIVDDFANAVADVDDQGAGNDVVVTFDNGSTLTFAGVGTGAITNVAQLFADINVQVGTFD